mmetsp:Transcript_64458/g.185271  ORF Transcript_64458/g.185271 Transcript_64458/m.185271 type:complete len:147 (-) Transcript_64458:384-824(-)
MSLDSEWRLSSLLPVLLPSEPRYPSGESAAIGRKAPPKAGLEGVDLSDSGKRGIAIGDFASAGDHKSQAGGGKQGARVSEEELREEPPMPSPAPTSDANTASLANTRLGDSFATGPVSHTAAAAAALGAETAALGATLLRRLPRGD